jgi:cell division septum initiation protein DivIVA
MVDDQGAQMARDRREFHLFISQARNVLSEATETLEEIAAAERAFDPSSFHDVKGAAGALEVISSHFETLQAVHSDLRGLQRRCQQAQSRFVSPVASPATENRITTDIGVRATHTAFNSWKLSN